MAILRFNKNAGARLSPHFISTEFDCPCDDPNCKETIIDESLIVNLEKMHEEEQAALKINSGHRCKYYQNVLRLRGYETSTGPSKHEDGGAADVSRVDERKNGVELEKSARKAGFTSVGVGHSFVHVDTRPGYRRWEYTKR